MLIAVLMTEYRTSITVEIVTKRRKSMQNRSFLVAVLSTVLHALSLKHVTFLLFSDPIYIIFIIVPTPLVGGRNYILKWVFFCSVNFGRPIYSS